MPGDDSRLIAQYDSFEEPEQRSDFLEANGLTRAHITSARRRLDAAERNAAATASESNKSTPPVHNAELPLRGPRSPRRRRAPLTRPPAKGRLRRPRQRRTPRRIVLVIIIELD